MDSQFHTRKPLFFKVILADTIQQRRLEIPSGFVKFFGDCSSNRVTLRVPAGNSWEVEMLKIGEEVCLSKGWVEFSEHHSIEHGHLLVFKYEGNSQFNVTIFDMSAVEIDYPGSRDTKSQPKMKKNKQNNARLSNHQQHSQDFGELEVVTGNFDIVPRLQESNLPLDMEENNKKDCGDIKYENNNEEFGDVENGSQGNPDALVHKDTGEMEEIDQIKSPGKSKKNIESRSMKPFKVLLAKFVKKVLDPSWSRGKMTKEAYKSIVKKTVDKVSGSLRSHQVPNSEAKINQYIESSQRKLTKLVMEYVDKHAKG